MAVWGCGWVWHMMVAGAVKLGETQEGGWGHTPVHSLAHTWLVMAAVMGGLPV